MYVYAYRNSIGNFYGQPFITGDDVNVTSAKFSRMMFAADDKQLDSLCEDELHLIGTFDDITGELTPSKEFVLNMGALVTQVRQARAVKDETDGKNEN